MNPRVEARIVFLVVGVLTLAVAVTGSKGGLRRGSAFLAAWLVPGAGHALLGKWKKGLFFFSVLGFTALFGFWITGFRPVSWDDNPFYYVGQYGSGLMMLLSKLISKEKAFPRPDLPLSWFDPGLLYVCVAGLLNAVVAMNVLEIRPKAAPSGEAPVPAAADPSPPPAAPPPGEGRP